MKKFFQSLLSPLAFFKRQKLKNIARQNDPLQIEAARDRVETSQDVEALIKQYWQATSWDEKRALVEMLQDQAHPQLAGLMLDFLRAPLSPGDEQTELAQAIALGFIDERYDRYMDYYNDRALLAQTVERVLTENGLQPEKPPPPVNRPAPPLQIDPDMSAGSRLIEGIRLNNRAVVEQALQDNARVDSIVVNGNHKGCSALIYAISLGHFELAETLLRHGADVNFTRSDLHEKFIPGRGQTALWWAANKGNLQLAEQLILRGANVNTPDHHGGTPLTTAASAGQTEMVEYLLNRGADIHAKISDGRTAFNLAVTNGHVEIAKTLIAAGNDPNARGGSGYTPLMVAAENNFYDLAVLLLEKGADVNATHSGNGIYIALRGWSALNFSVNAGLVKMSRLLIQNGANIQHHVPAGKRWDGQPLPERGMLDFARGKRAESLQKLLKQHGLE